MTPNDIILDVKRLAQDSTLLRTPDTYRDETLLGFVNNILQQTAIYRPDLFAKSVSLLTTPNSVSQVMPADSIRLIEIFYCEQGGALEEVDRARFNRTYPDWVNSNAGVPIKFMRHQRNPNAYFLYPKPQADITLAGEYAQSPPTYTINETIELLPDAYRPAIVYGTAYMVEAINNDMSGASDSNRARELNAMYFKALELATDGRILTDIENAGVAIRAAQ